MAAAAFSWHCIEEPHCRSTVAAQTLDGQPATSVAMRPTFSACSPIWVTQPICTSSISLGSRSWRATSPFSTCAASSSARTEESVPFRFPIGLRTASTISASVIGSGYRGLTGPRRRTRPGQATSPGYCEKAPRAGNAFQLVLAALVELEPRARDEVLDRAGDEHLARARRGRYARADVDGDAADLAGGDLAFARVQAGANLEPERVHRIPDG